MGVRIFELFLWGPVFAALKVNPVKYLYSSESGKPRFKKYICVQPDTLWPDNWLCGMWGKERR